MGLEKSLLSHELLDYLHDYGLFNLDQFKDGADGFTTSVYWLFADEIELAGAWDEEWRHYFSCIVESGIRLQEALDYLVWSYNCKMGNITAKMAYQFNLDNHLPIVELWWHKNLWSWNLPIKLKCLCWLNIYNDQYLG